MSGVQIVEGGYYLTAGGERVGPARYEPGPFTPHHPWKLHFAKFDVDVRYDADGHCWRAGPDEALLNLAAVWDGTEPPAPSERSSATPAGGGGSEGRARPAARPEGEARDGGGASGTEAGPDIARLYGAGFLKPSAGEGSTPPPSGPAGLPQGEPLVSPVLRTPLPGGEETLSAATLDLQPLDFAPLDRLRRVCFGEGFVSIRVDAGMTDEQCWFVLSEGDALELSGRIQARLGFAMGGPLIGLAMAALSGACAASAFHLLF